MDWLMIQGRVCRDDYRKSVGRRKGPRTDRGTEESLEAEETEGVEARNPECHQQLLSVLCSPLLPT